MKKFKTLFLLPIVTVFLTSCETLKDIHIAQDFMGDGTFTNGIEGPVVDKKGNVYAVNLDRPGTIGVIKSDVNPPKAELYVALPEGSIGNGLRFDKEENLYVADYLGHNILKVDKTSKAISVYSHNGEMNQPNDIAISPSGILYASDPDWENDAGNIWKIDGAGKTQLLASNMGTTNGIEVSPDGKILYINESVQRQVWQYDIDQSGAISNKRLLISFSDFGLDGMRSDSIGNLYIARYGKGVVAIVSKEGQLLKEVKLKGQYPTNLAFGGPDGQTVYVTLQKRGAIESFRNNIPGRAFSP